MTEDTQPASTTENLTLRLNKPLHSLTAWQIQKIDEVLSKLGPFGEVRLIKERGRLRFIERMESESLLGPYSPGR